MDYIIENLDSTSLLADLGEKLDRMNWYMMCTGLDMSQSNELHYSQARDTGIQLIGNWSLTCDQWCIIAFSSVSL